MPKAHQVPARARAIQDIEAGLKSLSRGLRRLVRDFGGSSNGQAPRPRIVTPALRLQGRYMGLIRTLPAGKKNRVKAVRARKGVEAAIKVARSLRNAGH